MAQPLLPPQPGEVPDYGIDSPDVVRRFLTLGTVLVVLHFTTPSLAHLLPGWIAVTFVRLAPSFAVLGYGFVATAGVMLWGSRRGKLRLRDRVLAALPWRGDERVIDIGCGHGLLMIGAAQRLSSGKAIGIDIWLDASTMRNCPEAALRNARISGVLDRVEVHTADARELPFDAQCFDLATASWSLSQLPEREQRERALREIQRVLKPGGRVVLVDVRYGREYADQLRLLGFDNIHVSLPNFLFVSPTLTVTAQKPA